MMANLFSMFDPSTYYLKASWMIMCVPVLILMGSQFQKKVKKEMALNTPSNKVKNEIKTLNMSAEKKATSTNLKKMFYSTMMLNMIAILPMNFTVNAHISVSMFLSVTLWLSTMINATANFMKSTMTHLTPVGTPTMLMNFMVIIELVSNIIRPITLAVRLTANMVAGHLLMSLLSKFSMMSEINFTMSSAPMMILIMLEMAVAVIQAYVISTLICLYYKETF